MGSTGKLRDWRRAPASLRLCRPAPTRKMNPSEDRSSLLRKSKKSLFLPPTFTDGYGSSSFPSNNLNSDSSGVDIQLLFCSRVCLINRSLKEELVTTVTILKRKNVILYNIIHFPKLVKIL